MTLACLSVILAGPSASAACVAKTGHMAFGLLKQPKTVRPECGAPRRMLDKLMEIFDEATSGGPRLQHWQEMFVGAPSSAKGVMDAVGYGLAGAGYRFVNQRRADNGRQHLLFYAAPGERDFLMVMYMLAGERFYVGFITMRQP